MPPADAPHTLLLIGASRGLGLAMVSEFLNKDWNVVATVRAGSNRTKLESLGQKHPGRLEVETLDICDTAQLAELRQRLAGRSFGVLFVNAGVTNNEQETVGEVTTAEFTRVFVTNALSPLRVIESLASLVPDDGLLGIMSSGQGSVANNTAGMREVYRGSKAALNQFMRSYAARERNSHNKRAMVLMAPGWVRTEMGGPEGRLSIDESIPSLVNVLLEKRGRPGLEYLDYTGKTVPW